jgi:23S rRNA pseudouridine955/2504/2580 synthase
MGAPRKTGKRQQPELVSPDAPLRSPSPVASDRVCHVEVTADHAGQRLDNFLIRLAKGVPKSHVYRIVRSGEVRVNKGRVAVDYRLQPGDDVRIPPLRTALPDPATRSGAAPPLSPPILFEDADLLVVDKPSGVAAHGGSGVAHGVIERVRAARPHQAFLELAHRLDRETSGILMLAKSRRALQSLHAQLRDGDVDKRYLLLVAGDWVNDRQHIKLALSKFVNHAGERRVAVDPEGMASHTVLSLKQRLDDFSLLEAELRTGRTHQIRVHVAHLGFPIAGDDKYGDFELNRRLSRGEFGPRFGRMFLHACATRLAHPVTGEMLELVCALPPDCTDILKALAARKHAASV